MWQLRVAFLTPRLAPADLHMKRAHQVRDARPLPVRPLRVAF